MGKRKVILVTDGDQVAGKALQTAAQNVGARCISLSTGNPTPISGEELLKLIKQAAHDPVIVMFDDRGKKGAGAGEKALMYIANHKDIEVLGVLAVASNTDGDRVAVECSVSSKGWVVAGPVDKNGKAVGEYTQFLSGDTVGVLNQLDIPVLIGIGDIGKMEGLDDCARGAPLTTSALKYILERNGYKSEGRN